MDVRLGEILAVGAGSCLGGIARFLVGKLLPSAAGALPWATLSVNATGCFLIGLIYGMTDSMNGFSRTLLLFLTVGFCGGLTTFSTFVGEGGRMLQGSHLWSAVGYMALSIACGLILFAVGYKLAAR